MDKSGRPIWTRTGTTQTRRRHGHGHGRRTETGRAGQGRAALWVSKQKKRRNWASRSAFAHHTHGRRGWLRRSQYHAPCCSFFFPSPRLCLCLTLPLSLTLSLNDLFTFDMETWLMQKQRPCHFLRPPPFTPPKKQKRYQKVAAKTRPR